MSSGHPCFTSRPPAELAPSPETSCPCLGWQRGPEGGVAGTGTGTGPDLSCHALKDAPPNTRHKTPGREALLNPGLHRPQRHDPSTSEEEPAKPCLLLGGMLTALAEGSSPEGSTNGRTVGTMVRVHLHLELLDLRPVLKVIQVVNKEEEMRTTFLVHDSWTPAEGRRWNIGG